jgi:cytochrome c-type biogenesis protein CcmF
VIAWRKATPRNLQRNFLLPGTVGAAVGVVLYTMGARHPQALLTFALGAFVLTVIVVEFWKGTRARARIEGEPVPTAFVHLVRRNRQRWGGYIIHVGMVLLFVGLAGNAYNVEVRQNVVPGETIRIQSPFGHEYALQYQGLSTHIEPGHLRQVIALLTVDLDGRPVGSLAPQRNYVTVPGQPMQPISEIRYRSTLLEDLYVILDGYDEDVIGVLEGRPDLQEATIVVLVNPLVPWIWYGALVVLVGTLIGLWPGAGVPVRRVRSGVSGPDSRDDPDGSEATRPAAVGGAPAHAG